MPLKPNKGFILRSPDKATARYWVNLLISDAKTADNVEVILKWAIEIVRRGTPGFPTIGSVCCAIGLSEQETRAVSRHRRRTMGDLTYVMGRARKIA